MGGAGVGRGRGWGAQGFFLEGRGEQGLSSMVEGGRGVGECLNPRVVREVTLSCGCQCKSKPAAPTKVMPVDGSPGRCVEAAATTPSFTCDLMGDKWCETEESTKWEMTGAGPGACAQVASTITRPVSDYNPTAEFARLPEP